MSLNCAICIMAYEDEEAPDVVVIKCGHAFHRTCLFEWKNSSKQLTCPECRTKYTVRTLTKLYLNVLPKEAENFPPTELHNQLQKQMLQSANLQRDKERLVLEKQQMEFDLLKSRDEFRNLMRSNVDTKRAFAIKCEEYSLINGVNDEYLNINKTLKDENKELKNQIGNLKQEVAEVKVHQLRTSKPFVDLTCDDDSDIEIVDDNVAKDITKPTDPAVVIDLDDEAAPALKSDTTTADKGSCLPSIPKKEMNFFKDSAANMDDSTMNDLQSFENFILEQI